MPEIKISKNFSMKGWNIPALMKGNKEAIKIVVAFVFGLWVPVDPTLKFVVGGLGKLALDSLDFYVNKVEIPKQ